MKSHLSCLLTVAALLVQGCAVPRTISVYDEACQVVAKKMVLDVKATNAAAKCSDRECLGEVISNGVVLAASTIVSGSIVVAGNVVYWLEKKQNCQAKKTIPELPAASQ